jgi:hypothetical protein
MNLADIFNTIKSQTHLTPTKTHLIYIGVGTYAGLKEPDGSLADKNYHQYPPFIQHLKNSLPYLQLSIVLIDPHQENPPYLTQDKGLLLNDSNNVNHTDIYYSSDHSLTLYTLRERITTDAYTHNNDDIVNITSLLRDLNNYVIANDIALIYHDFSGRDNRLLAEYFDEEIGEHLDHIIYGLGLREDFGCYFDLSHPCSYHLFSLNRQRKLRFFNIYYFIINGKINDMNTINTTINTKNNIDTLNRKSVIDHHLEKMLFIVKNELNTVVLQVLRVVFRLVMGEEIQDIHSDFYFLFGIKRETCISFIREKNYCDLYNYLLNIFGKKLDIVSAIKGLDITGREILECITLGDDPFAWYNNVKHFF